MKRFLLILVALFWCNVGVSKDCSHIDYKKSKDEFVQCVKIEYQKSDKSFFKRSKDFINWLFEDDQKNDTILQNTLTSSSYNIDFECLNLCKESIKGGFTIGQLNSFCKLQCQR